ncbi:MAG: hypothetical protein WCY29_06130 [Novosphingobium sp.]
MRPRFAVLALAVGALIAGCAEQVAENRVRSALMRAGLAEDHADCMAHRMVDRLTLAQLRKLEALEELEGGKRSIADYVLAVRRVDDPEVLAVTVTSAGLCAAGLAR